MPRICAMSNQGTTDSDLLTPAQAGELLGHSDETMRRWAKAKRIRHVRLPSGRVMFRRSDLEQVYEVVEPEATAS